MDSLKFFEATSALLVIKRQFAALENLWVHVRNLLRIEADN